MIMDKPRYLLATILFVICLNESVLALAQIKRPNIIFLLADDLGYTDIGPYGSEVNTPALSMLAEQGIMFTNYHTAANCAPSRAMLLTGVNNHLAGVPNIPETFTPEQRLSKNYQGVLGDNVVTIATLLEDLCALQRLYLLSVQVLELFSVSYTHLTLPTNREV